MGKYIKGFIPYTGNKYKLLNQIIPLFPKTHTFVDLFCGSGCVGINVLDKYDKVVFNDKYHIYSLLKWIENNKLEVLIKDISNYINILRLSNSNKDGYYQLRDMYKKLKNDIFLYLLVCHSFNHQIRFNSKGEFNLPFGNRTFNKNIEQQLIDFKNELEKYKYKGKIEFVSMDYSDILMTYSSLSESTFIYCDPPYWNTTATYNESNWNEQNENILYYLLSSLPKQVKFGLSNIIEKDGIRNAKLDKFIEDNDLKVIEIDSNYTNCSSNKKNRKNDTIEIYCYKE